MIQEKDPVRAGITMSERVERLDRSMDLVLVFLSILSAALFQFVTAIPYDPANSSQVTIFSFFMRFSLKLLFLPFLLVIPLWLVTHITQNENWRMLLRIIVWDLSSMAMALNAVALVVFGISFNWQPLNYPYILFSVTLVGVAFGLAALLHMTVIKAYIRALIMDPRAPANDFFFRKRWQYASSLVPLIAFLLLIGILLASLFL
jgi:hypothetical protein